MSYFLDQESFIKASELIESILKLKNASEIERLIANSVVGMNPELTRLYYMHLKMLLLNVQLNRIYELGPGAYERASEAKIIVQRLINELHAQ